MRQTGLQLWAPSQKRAIHRLGAAGGAGVSMIAWSSKSLSQVLTKLTTPACWRSPCTDPTSDCNKLFAIFRIAIG